MNENEHGAASSIEAVMAQDGRARIAASTIVAGLSR
jgi:1-deoxy-D-xylulose-5-phosphate reductoisomerase